MMIVWILFCILSLCINIFTFVEWIRKPNIFDNIQAMMEKYTNNLEVLVDERTEQLLEEKKKTGNAPIRCIVYYIQ